MVTVIRTNRSMRSVLHYNEQKINHGDALCLLANNFPKELKNLTFNQKLRRFTLLAALNERVIKNALHISLNFHPSEEIGTRKMQQIAQAYMKKIGFGSQPYLVYSHQDAGHPHMHIVTTNIHPTGKRIELYYCSSQLLNASREIEQEFQLMKVEPRSKKLRHAVEPGISQRIKYGKTGTVQSIAAVLSQVIDVYRYTSLVELEAILNLYNLSVSRGMEHSQTFKKRGLVYRILDENGKAVGMRVKASLLPEKPVLSVLEQKFEHNQTARLVHLPRVRNVVERSLLKPGQTIAGMVRALNNEQIDAVFTQNKQGFQNDILFVDHKTKIVCKGEDLGHQYTARHLEQRCKQPLSPTPFIQEKSATQIQTNERTRREDEISLPITYHHAPEVKTPDRQKMEKHFYTP
jgi:hypothetical protein